MLIISIIIEIKYNFFSPSQSFIYFLIIKFLLKDQVILQLFALFWNVFSNNCRSQELQGLGL